MNKSDPREQINDRLCKSEAVFARALGVEPGDLFAAIERHKAERARRRRIAVVVLAALAAALLVVGLAWGDELVREGRYTLLDDQGQVVSEHNELHVAIREGQDWSRENDGRTFYIEPPKYRGSVDVDGDPPIVEPPAPPVVVPPVVESPSDAILVAPGDDIQAAIDRLQPGGTLLFERGGVYQGGLGRWRISGLSAEQPTVVGAYGDPSLPRPKFLTDGQDDIGLIRSYGDEPIRHVIFRDLHGYANNRDPESRDFDGGRSREFGIRWSAAGGDIRFENLLLEHYAFNVGLGERADDIDGITLHRCVLRNAYSDHGHSQGLYTNRVRNLTITECVFDHNGWLDDADHGRRTGFNHNMYLTSSRNVTIAGNVIANGSTLGIKLRSDRAGLSSDITIEGNLFVGNLAGVSLGSDNVDGDLSAIVHERLTIRGNVFTHHGGALPGGAVLGRAISVKQAADVVVEDNLFIDKVATTEWFAVEVKPDLPTGDVHIRRNVLDRWPVPAGRAALIHEDMAALDEVTVEDNLIETGAATRRLDDYDGIWLEAVPWLVEGVSE